MNGKIFEYDKSSGKYTRKNSSIITWFCIERLTNDFLNKTVEILEDNTEEIEELLIKLLEKVKNTPDDVIEQAIDSLQEKLRKEKE